MSDYKFNTIKELLEAPKKEEADEVVASTEEAVEVVEEVAEATEESAE